jgi:CRISPR/Cas system-associated exonuclease Cas4 (RecB family)
MSSIESANRGSLRRRVLPTLVTFIVAGGAIYLTAWIAVDLLRHVVMPIVAVLVAGYLAVQVYRFTGRER